MSFWQDKVDNHPGIPMKYGYVIFVFCWIATIVATSYAAEVRVCNNGNVALTNLDDNSWKIPKLDVGECTAYFNNPMAQEYVTITTRMNGTIMSFRPKKTSYLLGDGKFSYQVSVTDDELHLETVKD